MTSHHPSFLYRLATASKRIESDPWGESRLFFELGHRSGSNYTKSLSLKHRTQSMITLCAFTGISAIPIMWPHKIWNLPVEVSQQLLSPRRPSSSPLNNNLSISPQS